MKSIDNGMFVVKRLKENGFEAYFVGGCVRDYLLKEEVNDIDITTNAKPRQVMNLFNKTVPSGLKYGTVTVLHQHNKIEVTTFRVDGEYSDSRHPDEVILTDLAVLDVERRDFTINGLLMDENYQITDHVNGVVDLENKVIKAIGNPTERFNEDALRMLRAIYFQAKLDFEIHPDTIKGIKENAHKIELLPNERVYNELIKALYGKHQNRAIKSLYETGLYKHLKGLSKGIEYISKNIDRNISVDVFFSLSFYLDGKIDRVWKLSNVDRNKYQKVIELLKSNPTFDQINIYEYGLEINVLASLTLSNLKKPSVTISEINNTFEKMPLKSLTDLRVRGNDILRITDKKRGAWLSQLLNELAYKVLKGELKNDKKSLLKYCEETLNEE